MNDFKIVCIEGNHVAECFASLSNSLENELSEYRPEFWSVNPYPKQGVNIQPIMVFCLAVYLTKTDSRLDAIFNQAPAMMNAAMQIMKRPQEPEDFPEDLAKDVDLFNNIIIQEQCTHDWDIQTMNGRSFAICIKCGKTEEKQ